MKPDKQVKKEFKIIASQDPDKYYATEVLKKEGFVRNTCSKCGLKFWNVDATRTICGDPDCSGGFDVVSNNPSKVKLSYEDVWNTFSNHMKQRGYTPIERYPVVARWNPTTDFTMASIAAFQPYVISGEIEPPAKKLVIPQFSLRFGDVDNVGVTGSHLTGFVMIGQHQFVPPEEWSQNQAFEDVYSYIRQVVGLPKEELTMHEDAWAGGGNYGPCMEFFSRGVELFNQVYMMFEQTEQGDRGLSIKVLDMGLGMERIAWFSQATPNAYEAVFPKVLHYLEGKTHVVPDHELFKKFSKYSAYLNIDEVEDINVAWNNVAKQIGVESGEVLKEKIQPMVALYSIAEHTRSLLFAIADGALPSNVGGGYNLRVILRRALSFIDKFGWDIKLKDVAQVHADELYGIFPELKKNLSDVSKILDIETEKYHATKEKSQAIIQKVIKTDVDLNKLLELYDAQGIMPDTVKSEAKKIGKQIDVPDDFFMKVAQLHEQREQKTQTVKEEHLDIDELPSTKILYFYDWDTVEFDAKVLTIIDNKVVLDQTLFYPTSGGQIHDIGVLGGCTVTDVYKQGAYVIHVVDTCALKVGDTIKGVVNKERRQQLTQHHSAAHIINGAAKKLLGSHIWQAGAAKTLEKGRLDITHFDALTPDVMAQIEEEANRIVQEDLPVTKQVIPRGLAEKQYGFVLYQGGVAPGRELRIVDYAGYDVEACGGTHVNHTGEVKLIKLLKSSKIQDGVVRIEYVAGERAVEENAKITQILRDSSKVLGVDEQYLVSRSEQLFNLWKKAKKLVGKVNDANYVTLIQSGQVDANLAYVQDKEVTENVLMELSKVLKTQPDNVVKTLERFMTEFNENKKKIDQALA